MSVGPANVYVLRVLRNAPASTSRALILAGAMPWVALKVHTVKAPAPPDIEGTELLGGWSGGYPQGEDGCRQCREKVREIIASYEASRAK